MDGAGGMNRRSSQLAPPSRSRASSNAEAHSPRRGSVLRVHTPQPSPSLKPDGLHRTRSTSVRVAPEEETWAREKEPEPSTLDTARTSVQSPRVKKRRWRAYVFRQMAKYADRIRYGKLNMDFGWDKMQSMLRLERQRQDAEKNKYSKRALFFLNPDNPFRLKVIQLQDNPWFDRVVLFLIIANCVILGFSEPVCELEPQYLRYYDHSCGEENSNWKATSDIAEIVFTCLFTLEMVIKVIARGFVLHDYAYLRIGWNVIDFIAVSIGIASLLPGISNVNAIRTVRVLKPLRTVARVPGMRILLTALVSAIVPMSNVLVLFAFVFFIFGIIGVQLFTGAFRPRCVYMEGALRGLAVDNEPCSSGGRHCEVGECQALNDNGEPRPNTAFTHFDNMGWAYLTIFQVISKEGWSGVMYDLESGWEPWSARIYFISLILLGSFFAVNLALAVISLSFEVATEDDKIMVAKQASPTSPRSPRAPWFWALLLSRFKKRVLPAPQPGQPPPSQRPLRRTFKKFRQRLRVIVASKRFMNGIYVLIMINTFLLSVDYFDSQIFEEGLIHGMTTSSQVPPEWRNHVLEIQETPGARLNMVNKTLLAMLKFEDLCADSDECSGMPDWVYEALDVSNKVLTALFTLEMILKLGAEGTHYFEQAFNLFDGAIVIISLVEVFTTASTSLSVFRALRLFRVFKLARQWAALQRIFLTIASSVALLGPLTLVLFVFLYMYSLVGMELFGGRFRFIDEDDEMYIPRSNFDSILPNKYGFGAMITVFQILTGENWNTVMFDGMAATHPIVAIYFISCVILGSYVVMNMFLAILLQGFDQVGDEDFEGEEEEANNADEDNSDEEENVSHSKSRQATPEPTVAVQLSASAKSDMSPSRFFKNFFGSIDNNSNTVWPDPKGRSNSISSSKSFMIPAARQPTSLFCFAKSNPIRRFARRLSRSTAFENIILFFIILSTLSLAILNPKEDPNSTLYYVLGVLDIVYVVIFTTEMAIKVVASGLILHRKAYLRDPWNILDFLIVVISILSLDVLEVFKPLKVARTFRALRPLRVIHRLPGLRTSVNCLIRSMPSMLNVFVVCMLFIVMFSILGVQFLNGALHKCTIPLLPSGKPVLNIIECSVAGGDWETSPHETFDNVPLGVLTLFEVATMEGWIRVMSTAVDSVGKGFSPQVNARPLMALYFMLYLIVVAFFCLNLFVGVVVDNYNKIKKQEDSVSSVTPEQRLWIDLLRDIVKTKPQNDVPQLENRFRIMLLAVVRHWAFEGLVALAIVVNVCLMASKSFDQSPEMTRFLSLSSAVFTIIFAAEMILKLVALTPFYYFRDGWNVFDCILSVTSVAALLLEQYAASASVDVPETSLLRIFRLARLFRLIKSLSSVRLLMESLYFSLPALGNVGTLLLLLFSTYSIMGVFFFHNVKWHQTPDDYINAHANFENFGNAFLILLRMSTGEDWNGIMHDCMMGACEVAKYTDGCGSYFAAVVYFVSFLLLCTFITLNLLVAVIMSNFHSVSANFDSHLPKDKMQDFAKKWVAFDPEADGTIPTLELHRLLSCLEPPLGWRGRKMTGLRFLEIMAATDIPDHNGYVQYLETFYGLANSVLGKDVPPSELDKFERVCAKDIQASHLFMHPANSTVAKVYAARFIQRAFRAKVKRRQRLEKELEQAQREQEEEERLEALIRAQKVDLRARKAVFSIEMQNAAASDDLPATHAYSRRRR